MNVAAAPLTVEQAFRMALAHQQAGRLAEAEQLLTRILQTVPNQPDALHELGVLAARRKDFAGAADLIERALAKSSEAGLYYRNVCEVYRRLGRLDDALAAAERAVKLNRDDPHSLVNLAIIYYACCRFADGVATAERALALDPNLPSAHFELAEALLVQGQFERGWDEYEWRFQIAGAANMLPKTDRPLWDGKPLDGKLLLVADQGFGDVIQFGRFIPWAHGISPDLVVRAIAGWAQNPDHPEAPVCLDIFAGGALIGRTLANRYRSDLDRGEVGSGCQGFEFTWPTGTSFAPEEIEVRVLRRSLAAAIPA